MARTKTCNGEVQRDAEGYDKDGWRVIWTGDEHVVTDDEWRAWCRAGCPDVDGPKIDRIREVVTHDSNGRVKVKPPYHKIVNDGNDCCKACGVAIVSSPSTRSGWKHAKRWAER